MFYVPKAIKAIFLSALIGTISVQQSHPFPWGFQVKCALPFLFIFTLQPSTKGGSKSAYKWAGQRPGDQERWAGGAQAARAGKQGAGGGRRQARAGAGGGSGRAGSPSAHHHDRRPQNHEDHGVRAHGHRAGPGRAGAPPPGPGAPPAPARC